MPSIASRFRGCLLGGAVGDALGAAVEFDSIERIRERFGPGGITEPAEAFGRVGAITDDTQMALFTADGLLRAYVRGSLRGIWHPPSMVDQSYGHWMLTQGEECPRWQLKPPAAGGLPALPELNHRRAPGNTCLSAMRAPDMGTMEEPINDSKGCGAVMRVAPVGLTGRVIDDVFHTGCEVGALTHGHPSGYLTAGALAEIIARLCAGGSLDAALESAEGRLKECRRHEETVTALKAARRLAHSSFQPSPDVVTTLGQGWVGEEALAIAVYCALVADDFAHGVRLAVNHSGDSDSTAAIAGNILGALLGYEAIPDAWLEILEARAILERMADMMIYVYGRQKPPDPEFEAWIENYPNW